MPLPINKDRRGSAVEFVIRKLKGSDSYENMKDQNEAGPEKMVQRQEPENSYKMGMEHAVDEIMAAAERKDRSSFMKGLKAFVQMVLDEQEDEQEMMKQD